MSNSFADNEAHSALSGYWFDFYSWDRKSRDPKVHVNRKFEPCVGLKNFSAWKIWEYGVYGEPQEAQLIHLERMRLADCRVGILIVSGGRDSLAHTLGKKKVHISDSLVVGHSENGHCMLTKPSLYTCKFYMAWCFVLPFYHVGLLFGSFPKGQNDGPKIHSWFETAPEPSLYGITELSAVRFVNFSTPCWSAEGPRRETRDLALASMPSKANPADGLGPLVIKGLRMEGVDDDSMFLFQKTDPKWINGADCIDMDCDGLRNGIVNDLDGSLVGGSGGTLFSRAEQFSTGSFFGLPLKDEDNHALMRKRFGVPSGDSGALGGDSESSEGWGDTWLD